jgi:hypothetical protein
VVEVVTVPASKHEALSSNPNTAKKKKKKKSQAHTCNPSYLGGRDQEDHGSKPTWANSVGDPIFKKKKSHKKGAGGVAQDVGTEVQTPT